MSEKRSWDIQPNRQPTPPVQPAPQAPPRAQQRQVQYPPQQTRPPRVAKLPKRQPSPKQRVPLFGPRKPKPIKVSPVHYERIPQGRDREPLKDRRRRARKLMIRLLSIAFVLIVVVCTALLWIPSLRIQEINTSGADASGMQSIARADLEGTYYYVIPKDSIFFFPLSNIRSSILSQYPDIDAVSVSRTSFHSILLTSVSREEAFLWCGTTYAPDTQTSADSMPLATTTPLATPAAPSTESASTTPGITESGSGAIAASPCYDADSEGFIYAQDSMPAPNEFSVYGPLAPGSGNAIGSSIANASSVPAALQFVKAIKDLSVPIVALVIRGDEADLYAQSGTRITYVLGREQMAYQLAESAFPSLNLNDGSLEYVDLRFDGKVYFKKNGDSQPGFSNAPATSQ